MLAGTSDEFYAAVGRLVVNWSFVELGLDSLVRTLYVHLGNPANDPERPRSLSRKLAYIKRSVQYIDFPDFSRSEFLEWVQRIEALAPFRHDITHGIILDSDGKDRALAIRSLPKSFEKKRIEVTTVEINECSLEVIFLAVKMVACGVLFYGEVTGDFPEPDPPFKLS